MARVIINFCIENVYIYVEKSENVSTTAITINSEYSEQGQCWDWINIFFKGNFYFKKTQGA